MIIGTGTDEGSAAGGDAPPVIDFQRVSYWRGERIILRDISWSVRKGEHWALLGANGSGKTTMLRIAGAYDWPCDGTVSVLGERFGTVDLRELRKAVGVVSAALVPYFPADQPALDVVLTGIDAQLGWWRTFEAPEREAGQAALAAVGLGDRGGSAWGVLSQGERQRVLIARGLINRPHLLILDEPCAGLDPGAREGFLEDLAGLVRAPGAPTLVFVTHHLEEIPPFVSRGLLLKGGEALGQGALADVLTDARVAEAFGRPFAVVRHGTRYGLRLTAAPT